MGWWEIQWNLKESSKSVFFLLVMLPLSYLYRFLLASRHALFAAGVLKTERLNSKVISIGNIEVGGTGKTPHCIALARHLIETQPNLGIGILSRGYGSTLKTGDTAVYIDGELSSLAASKLYDVMADEPRLMSSELPGVPVVVGGDRFKSAKWYLERSHRNVGCWIIDDGFQHVKLKRDLDIVLLSDAFVKGDIKYLLPAGKLRETDSRLNHSGVLCVHPRSMMKEEDVLASHSGLSVSGNLYKSSVNVNPYESAREPDFEGRYALIVGVANPMRLVQSWKKNNYPIDESKMILLPDHGKLKQKHFGLLESWNCPVLTTSKDYFRDPSFFEKLKKPYKIVEYQATWSNEVLEKVDALFAP